MLRISLSLFVTIGLLASSSVYAQQQTNAVQSNNSNTTNYVNEEDEAVLDKRWNFLLLGTDERLEFDERPYFEIGSDGRVNGFDGCNRFFGQVELGESQRIEFKHMASTRMACPNMGNAQQVADMLNNSHRYLIDDDTLVFFAPDNRELGSWNNGDDLAAGVISGGTASDGIAGALGLSPSAVAVGAGVIVTGIVIGASNSGSSSGTTGTN